MAAAIIPAVQLGISAFSAYKQHKAQKQAQQQADQQVAAAEADAKTSREAITQQAPQFQQKDRQLTQIGLPLLKSSSNYYRALVGGDRGAIDSALSPERAALTETYRGAARGLTNLRGPTKDLATAELARQKAGALGVLPAAARANAVEGAQRAGEYATGAGMDAATRGASLYESAAGLAGGAANRAGAYGLGRQRIQLDTQRQNEESGRGMGGLIGEVLKGILNRRPGGGGGGGGTNFSWGGWNYSK